MLDYCGISEPAFGEGYGAGRDTPPPALIRRQFYLLYEMQKYMPIRVWRRNDPAERYKRQCWSLAMQLIPSQKRQVVLLFPLWALVEMGVCL